MQEMTNEGMQQGEKTLSKKNDHRDREKAEGDDRGKTDSEPMRLEEPWQKKMPTEGLIPGATWQNHKDGCLRTVPSASSIYPHILTSPNLL